MGTPGWRAIQGMDRGAQLDFQMQNLALWFGTAAGLAVTYPILTDDAIGMVLLLLAGGGDGGRTDHQVRATRRGAGGRIGRPGGSLSPFRPRFVSIAW